MGFEKGADINSRDNAVGQQLSLAGGNDYQDAVTAPRLNDYEDVLRLLVEGGVDVNPRDNDGRTPLSWAAESGYPDIVPLLVGKGARPDLDTNVDAR